jgi:hypothetical protein
MPYALIPDGYSLKKVTKLQKQALTDKRRHDNVVALLSNPSTPIIVGGGVATFFGVQLAKNIITEVEKTTGELASETKQAIREATQVTISLPTVTGPSGLPFQPQDIDVADIFKAGLERFGLKQD